MWFGGVHSLSSEELSHCIPLVSDFLTLICLYTQISWYVQEIPSLSLHVSFCIKVLHNVLNNMWTEQLSKVKMQKSALYWPKYIIINSVSDLKPTKVKKIYSQKIIIVTNSHVELCIHSFWLRTLPFSLCARLPRKARSVLKVYLRNTHVSCCVSVQFFVLLPYSIQIVCLLIIFAHYF